MSVACRAMDESRVVLRALDDKDEAEFVALTRASVDLHHPWMSLPMTGAEFRTFRARYDGVHSVCMLVCLREGGAIAGMMNINEIIRGRFQGGAIAYAAFAPTAGRGYLSEGLRLLMRYAFDELRMHRLEANIQPGNHASLRLVQPAGVHPEG